MQIDLDRRVLTIAGERASSVKAGNGSSSADARTTAHINERFAGRFRRVVSLPEDIDPSAVTADYRDGLLHVSIKRRAASQPRRVAVE